MTYSEFMEGWLDRIMSVAMKYLPEGADRSYVEAMVEQYKQTIRDIEGVHGHTYRTIEK